MKNSRPVVVFRVSSEHSRGGVLFVVAVVKILYPSALSPPVGRFPAFSTLIFCPNPNPYPTALLPRVWAGLWGMTTGLGSPILECLWGWQNSCGWGVEGPLLSQALFWKSAPLLLQTPSCPPQPYLCRCPLGKPLEWTVLFPAGFLQNFCSDAHASSEFGSGTMIPMLSLCLFPLRNEVLRPKTPHSLLKMKLCNFEKEAENWFEILFLFGMGGHSEAWNRYFLHMTFSMRVER